MGNFGLQDTSKRFPTVPTQILELPKQALALFGLIQNKKLPLLTDVSCCLGTVHPHNSLFVHALNKVDTGRTWPTAAIGISWRLHKSTAGTETLSTNTLSMPTTTATTSFSPMCVVLDLPASQIPQIDRMRADRHRYLQFSSLDAHPATLLLRSLFYGHTPSCLAGLRHADEKVAPRTDSSQGFVECLRTRKNT